MRKIYAGMILFLMAIASFPGFVYAQSVKVSRVVGPEEGSDASQAKFSVYFKVFARNGLFVSDIKASQCKLIVAHQNPKIISRGIRPFEEGDEGVGVLVVYPMSKNYSEDSFGIRSNLTAFLRNRERDVDWFAAIGYDNVPHPVGWSKASEKKVALAVRRGETSDVIEPNLFSTMQPAIAMLKNLDQVSQKYLVIITDAEGAYFNDRESSLRMIDAFKKGLIANNITPIVVGYSPDGLYAMPNIHSFGRITTDIGSLYITDSVNRFQQVLMRDVVERIWGGYIYDVTYDMRGDNYLKADKYGVQMKVRTSEGGAIGYSSVHVPSLKRMPSWLIWALLAAFAGFGVCGFGIVLWRKEVARKAEEQELLDEEDRRAEEMARAFAAEKMDINAPSAVVDEPYMSGNSDQEDSIEICEHAVWKPAVAPSSVAEGADDLGRMEALLDNILVTVTRSEILLEKLLTVARLISENRVDAGQVHVGAADPVAETAAPEAEAVAEAEAPEAEAVAEAEAPEAEAAALESEDDACEDEDEDDACEDEDEDDESEDEDDESEDEDDESEDEDVTEADKPEKAKSSDLDLLGLFMDADVSGLSAIGLLSSKPEDISSPDDLWGIGGDLSGNTRVEDQERPLT